MSVVKYSDSGLSFAQRLKLSGNIKRCYEAKIEESEKAGSRQESNPTSLA